MSTSSQIKSRQRVTAHGEVFTAEREVKAMCDLVADECERIDSRFLEPACGDGNFLAEVLSRKLTTVKKKYGTPLKRPDYEIWSVIAVSSVYGVELLQDNAQLCRERLYNIWNTAYTNTCSSDVNEECCRSVLYILQKNILCGDARSMKQDDNTPITFAEWSFIGGILVKRRDFELATLLKVAEEAKSRQIPLTLQYTSGNNAANPQKVIYDEVKREFIPVPIREYPPIDYRRVMEHG